MTACPRSPCPGTIGRTGFCAVCGYRPPKSGEATKIADDRVNVPTLTIPPPGVPSSVVPSRVTGTVATRPQQTTGRGTGDVEVPLPVVRLPDLPSRILSDPGVPEKDRFCGKLDCHGPVGRSLDGNSARLEGFCGRCGSRFSFVPRLHPGDRVAERYEVRGCIARGGLGFVYLATDLRLNRHVALKGLIDVNNTAAVRIAETESQVLIALEHPNIVRIQDVVPHEDSSYIVMEYVDGLPLSEVKNRGRLLVEHVVVYGREILTALAYLHGQGLLYCDMKPENVIHGDRRVKLIDFGAIRRIGDRDSPWIVTDGYTPRREELLERGLTVRSDVYAVGKTLQKLFNVSDGWRSSEEEKTPDRRDIAFGVRSVRHVLDRATADSYERRFASAQEMLVQLDGVLNEVLSLRDRGSRPVVSTLFAEPPVLLDAGLGQPPPLEHWTAGRAVPVGARPMVRDIALGLPVPLEDPHDEQIALLHTVRAPDAARLLKKLEKAGPSVEIQFRRCRAWLELSEVDRARECVQYAKLRLAERAEHDWRVWWHNGLIALAAGDVVAAATQFDAVYRDIPGEETPKLALGLCAEHGGEDAGQFYDALWVHRAQVNAAFGLARVALARGDRAAAVRVLDEVPESSRHDEAARIAGVRVLAGVLPRNASGGPFLPGEDDLRQAADRLSTVELDDQAGHRLRAGVLETALFCHEKLVAAEPLLGAEPDESGLRAALAETLRALAWHAPGRAHHEALIDLVNQTRPVSWV